MAESRRHHCPLAIRATLWDAGGGGQEGLLPVSPSSLQRSLGHMGSGEPGESLSRPASQRWPLRPPSCTVSPFQRLKQKGALWGEVGSQVCWRLALSLGQVAYSLDISDSPPISWDLPRAPVSRQHRKGHAGQEMFDGRIVGGCAPTDPAISPDPFPASRTLLLPPASGRFSTARLAGCLMSRHRPGHVGPEAHTTCGEGSP